MKVNPKIPCALRFSASIPTTDTERKAPFFFQDPWNPSHINLFGHNITIDIPTGNVVISTIDLSYPYYNMPLEISRKYDTQEQWMQLSTLRDYPNINPKPHFYGNWQLAEHHGRYDWQ